MPKRNREDLHAILAQEWRDWGGDFNHTIRFEDFGFEDEDAEREWLLDQSDIDSNGQKKDIVVSEEPHLQFFAETLRKKLLLDTSSDPETLHVEINGSVEHVSQKEMNEFLTQLQRDAAELRFAHFIPRTVVPDQEESQGDGVRYVKEFVKGADWEKADIRQADEHRRQLNRLIEGMMRLIHTSGYTLDIRSDNLKIDEGGRVKAVDLFPIISAEASPLTSGIGRDPYAFLLEHTQGALNAKNMHRLARFSDLGDELKEYWAIRAQEIRSRERKGGADFKKFKRKDLVDIAEDVLEALRELDQVVHAGIFGSMARNKERVNDIDLFAVVQNDAFRQFVGELKQEVHEKKYIRMAVYWNNRRSKNVLKTELSPTQKERISMKRKLSVGDVEKFVKTHMVLLPENPNDPDIQADLEWLTRMQPDVYFFINLLEDAQLSVREESQLTQTLGSQYRQLFLKMAKAEHERRQKLFFRVEEELDIREE